MSRTSASSPGRPSFRAVLIAGPLAECSERLRASRHDVADGLLAQEPALQRGVHLREHFVRGVVPARREPRKFAILSPPCNPTLWIMAWPWEMKHEIAVSVQSWGGAEPEPV